MLSSQKNKQFFAYSTYSHSNKPEKLKFFAFYITTGICHMYVKNTVACQGGSVDLDFSSWLPLFQLSILDRENKKALSLIAVSLNFLNGFKGGISSPFSSIFKKIKAKEFHLFCFCGSFFFFSSFVEFLILKKKEVKKTESLNLWGWFFGNA